MKKISQFSFFCTAYTRQRSNSLDDPSEHDPPYDSWLRVLAEEETVSPKKELSEQDLHDKNLT